MDSSSGSREFESRRRHLRCIVTACDPYASSAFRIGARDQLVAESNPPCASDITALYACPNNRPTPCAIDHVRLAAMVAQAPGRWHRGIPTYLADGRCDMRMSLSHVARVQYVGVSPLPAETT